MIVLNSINFVNTQAVTNLMPKGDQKFVNRFDVSSWSFDIGFCQKFIKNKAKIWFYHPAVTLLYIFFLNQR